MRTETELTAAQLGDRLGVTARMVNVYRAAAEAALGRKLGRKSGKQTFFSIEEQDLIASARAHAVSDGSKHEVSFDPDSIDDEEPGGVTNGMAAILTSGDQAAIAMGTQIGQRWTELMMQTAIAQMGKGVAKFAAQMNEASEFAQARASLQLKGSQPQIKGGLNYLESSDEEPDLG